MLHSSQRWKSRHLEKPDHRKDIPGFKAQNGRFEAKDIGLDQRKGGDLIPDLFLSSNSYTGFNY